MNELNEDEADKIVEDELTLIEFQNENIIAEEIKKMEIEIKQELTYAKIMTRPQIIKMKLGNFIKNSV